MTIKKKTPQSAGDLIRAKKSARPKNWPTSLEIAEVKKDFKDVAHGFYPDKAYEVDSVNQEAINLVLLHFAGAPNFDPKGLVKNKKGADITKGVLLFSDPGTGKTDCMKILQYMGFMYAQKYRVFDLQLHDIRAGDFVLNFNRKTRHKSEDGTAYYNLQMRSQLLIDDLGEEPKHYGEELLARVILDRYRAYKELNTRRLYITTNLTPGQIAERYGARVMDKLLELCNIIKFPGESRRS